MIEKTLNIVLIVLWIILVFIIMIILDWKIDKLKERVDKLEKEMKNDK